MNPKVAFVYDRINKQGGAERVLLALHEIWPDAPIYTSVYDPASAPWASGLRVIPSFINSVPLLRKRHEWIGWMMPLLFETFRFEEYDIVISVTSEFAKNIITKPDTLHICYCLTPTRYLWSGTRSYEENPAIGLPPVLVRTVLRMLKTRLSAVDRVASARPDRYIAISQAVKKRIETYYEKQVHCVVYPPVDTSLFLTHSAQTGQVMLNDYYLTVSRLVPYKRVDIIVEAFNSLGWPLVIVGDGVERKRLMQMARSNIYFTGEITDEELGRYYAGCKSFVYAGIEDFGIVAAEAQSYGKPVIAYNEGGIPEIVIPEKTGVLYDEQTSGSLINALKSHVGVWYDSSLCISQSKRFGKQLFKEKMKRTVQSLYNTYTKSLA